MTQSVAQTVCLAEPVEHRVGMAWVTGSWVVAVIAGNSVGESAGNATSAFSQILGIDLSGNASQPLVSTPGARSHGAFPKATSVKRTPSKLEAGTLPAEQGLAAQWMANEFWANERSTHGESKKKRLMNWASRQNFNSQICNDKACDQASKVVTDLKVQRISKISVPVSGCPTWIRTMTNRFRDCCATITPSGSRNRSSDLTRNSL